MTKCRRTLRTSRQLPVICIRWLSKILPEEDWTVRGQGPITLQDSEPEPDLVVARGPDSRYEKRHPGPGDIVLVIEVADSSLLEDRRNKGSLLCHASAKIPEFPGW